MLVPLHRRGKPTQDKLTIDDSHCQLRYHRYHLYRGEPVRYVGKRRVKAAVDVLRLARVVYPQWWVVKYKDGDPTNLMLSNLVVVPNPNA